jgi:hypothetical protein
MFELELVLERDSRLLSFLPAKTLPGPNVIVDDGLLIWPNFERSPAFGGGRGGPLPATAQPSGPTCAKSPRSPPRRDPPRDILI